MSALLPSPSPSPSPSPLPSSPAAMALDSGARTSPGELQVYGDRVGRIAAAVVVTLGAPALIVAALSASASPHVLAVDGWQVVVTTWTLAGIAWLVGRSIARRFFAAHAAALGDRLLIPSLVLPSVGLALLLPLTLHMPLALLIDGAKGFNAWAAISALVVGHAHLVLAFLSARRARAVVTGERARSPGSIFFWTVLASAIPFGVFYAIPPILTAITGLPVMVWLGTLDDTVRRERRRLADRIT